MARDVVAMDEGDGVGRSHESLDATRAVVRLDRRCRRCDYGSGGGDRRLHGELVGFSLTLLFPEGRRDGNGNQTEAAAVSEATTTAR